MLVAIGSAQAGAGIAYQLDLDTSEDGIQDALGASAGDVIEVDVVITLDDPTTLGNYQVSLRFDENELMFVSGTETPPAPEFDSISPITLGASDVINGIESGTLGTGLGAGTYTVATLTFNVLAPTGTQADLDLTFFEDIRFDGSFGGDSSTLTPTFSGGSVFDITAVPEPGSFAVVCVVACVFTVRRRR